MINVCTVSDKSYLPNGLALYESLSINKNIILHYLCIDQATFDILYKYSSKNLKVYHVKDLLSNDETLKKLKNSDYKYFCWSLASYFSNKMIKTNIDSITYIDSDIYFHKDIKKIYDGIGNKEVAIFRHRQFPLNFKPPDGLYNVGVVYFKNTPMGKKVSDWRADGV